MRPPSLSDLSDRQENPSVKLAIALFRIGQALGAARGMAASERSVSPLQLQVLIDLAQEAGGARTASALAQRYGLSAPTLSDSLALLTRRKLIVQRPSAADARRKDLHLTAKGRALADRALLELDQLVRICGEMPRAEREQALATSVGLIRRFTDLGWVRADRMCTTCRFFVRDLAPSDAAPHWCRLISKPLGAGDLRVDCPEHEPLVTSANKP